MRGYVIRSRVFKMTVKYLTRKPSGLYYFRRGIPFDLRTHFQGRSEFVQSLNTHSELEAAKLVRALATQLDQDFERLRGKSGQRDLAVKFLRKHNLKDARLEDQDFDQMEDFNPYDIMINSIEDEHLVDYDATPDGYKPNYREPNQEVQRAMDILKGREPITMSEARDLYQSKTDRPQRKNEIKRAFELFQNSLRRENVKEIRRLSVQQTLDRSQDEGRLTYGTIKKYKNIVNRAIEELIFLRESKIINPFNGVTLRSSKKVSKPHHTFTPSELKDVARFITKELEENTTRSSTKLIALLYNTGCRVGEVAGIKLDQIIVDNKIPHLEIKYNDNRPLKNENSVRYVPLFGVSLKMAVRIKKSAMEGEIYAFPEWNKGDRLKNDTASANARKTLRSIVQKGTSHSFRHALNTRLHEAGIPQNHIENWFGWTNTKMVNQYGTHVAFETLSKAAKALEVYESKTDSKYHLS